MEAVVFTIYVGVSFIKLQNELPGETAKFVYEAIQDTDIFESISISKGDISSGIPPFPGQEEPTTIIEAFPNEKLINNVLNPDGSNIFVTPVEAISSIEDNVTFPERDEILDGLLNEPFVFPGEVEVSPQIYIIDGSSGNPFPIGSSSSMGIQEVDDFLSTITPTRTRTTKKSNLFEIEHTGLLNYTIPTGKIGAQGKVETFEIDGFRGRTILDTKYVGNPTRSPFINNSQAPQFIRNNVLRQEQDQFRRTADLINNPSTPFTELEILVNDSRAVEYFESLLEEYNIPGQVIVVPTVVQ